MRTAATGRLPALPQQLEPELELPRIVGRGDRAERAGAAVAVRRAEVRVVQEIERLEPELELHGPADGERLRRGQIDLPELRPPHAVAAGVAERLARTGRHADARRVEPLRDARILRQRIATDVGAVVVGTAEVLRNP